MANPHGYASFDYKVINENISRVLDERSRLNNTIQMAMPFVKATTTIKLDEILKPGNVGFTLGLHAIEEDVKYEDIFSSQDGDLPLVGYTYKEDGTTQRVYAIDPAEEMVAKVFDYRARLFKNTEFVRIPPPGIEQVTIGRNRNGLLASAQINISIPSLIQLETLHKTFLVPGLGMVLEWGQAFAPGSTEDITGGNIADYMFPWHDQGKLLPLLRQLGANKIGLNDIMKDYVYPTNGQYMWMFGRVANFNVNANSDGSFKATVKIVGPSEDSWAFDTKRTMIPPKDASTQFFCAGKTNSIYSYFTETTVGQNFKTKLDDTINPSKNSPWKNHVIKFDFGNKKTGEPKPDEPSPVMSQNTFADAENAYFITWRFFVNEVLNGTENSVKSSVFAHALIDNEYELGKIGMLMPYAHGLNREVTGNELADPTKYGYINDPFESFVGMNPYLRSIDPSTMIIVNDLAVSLASGSQQYQMAASEKDIFKSMPKADEFAKVGLFEKSTTAFETGSNDRGFLSSGIWINHKAVVECMTTGNTLMRGIVNLLDRMSTATNGYWKLSLDPLEADTEFNSAYNYMVVDLNYKESSDRAVGKFIDNVHVFNKYVRVDSESGDLVGSELIENSVDLSLPKLLFTQIATLGLVQPEDIALAMKKENQQSGQPTEPEPDSPKISDPNDTLRRMFAITSLVAPSDDAQGPDLTIPPKTERKLLLDAQKQCTGQNTQTTAQTAGSGNRSDTPSLPENLKNQSAEQLEKIQKDNKTLLDTEECKQCLACETPTVQRTPQQITAQYTSYVGKSGRVVPIVVNYNDAGKLDSTKKLYNAGYRNGRLSAPALISSTGGAYLYRDVAPKWNQMVSAAARDGIKLTHNWAYRSLPEQISIAKREGLYGKEAPRDSVNSAGKAATPGNSNHGWGFALDINVGKSYTSKTYLWLKENGKKFGFENTVAGEPHHWEYTGPIADPPKINPQQTPTPTPTVTAKPSNFNCTEFLSKHSDACKKCKSAKSANDQINKVLPDKQKFTVFIRQFDGLQELFKYIEIFPDYMTAAITGTADGNVANAFGSSPGTLAIKADLTLPGINGMRVGELFWLDRIPSFYKAFGAFQIMSIEDTIDLNGWKTKVHAQFNYLGTKWKQAMETRLRGA